MSCVLKDLIELSKDGEWGKEEPFTDSVEMLCVRGTDFENVRFGDLHSVPRRYVPKRIAAYKTLRAWDLIIETAGGTKGQITGRTILLRPRLFARADVPVTCASFSRFIRFRADRCDPEFMFWYLQYLYGAGFLDAYHTQHTGVSRFQWTTFAENEPVALPEVPLQRRIAGILSAYDNLIENNLRRIRILEEMARTLYREWFVEFRFPGHEKVRRGSSSLGSIPEGWPVRKLSELVDTQYGYTESASQEAVGPKYLRGMDINKASYIDWAQVPYCPIGEQEKHVYQLRKGDILVIRMADPGKVGIVEEEVDAVFASYLIRLTPTDEALLPYFLFHLLDSSAYQDYVSGASTGTTRKSASAGVITDFRVPLPPKGLVEAFEERARSLRALLATLLRQTANLRSTRDLLLPRLLSGQVALKDTAA